VVTEDRLETVLDINPGSVSVRIADNLGALREMQLNVYYE
jgi:hypothetical protein